MKEAEAVALNILRAEFDRVYDEYMQGNLSLWRRLQNLLAMSRG